MVVNYGLRELGLNRIYSTVFAGNTASRRVAEKAGMRYEGCMRQHVSKWSKFMDLEVYDVLAADFAAAAQPLK